MQHKRTAAFHLALRRAAEPVSQSAWRRTGSSVTAMRSRPLTQCEQAFAHAAIGMALVDPFGHLLRVNDALCSAIGYTKAQLMASSFRELCESKDVDLDVTQLEDLRHGRVSRYQVEKQFRHAQGHPVSMLVSMSVVRNAEGGPEYFIAQVQDISERKALEKRLKSLVHHDHLTGLFNGRRFEEELAQAVKSAARYGGGGALLLVDVDHFKTVNDQLGHKAGDELLQTVAAEMRGRLRATDVLARLGGDEFGIILRQVDAEHAEMIAEGIVKALRPRTATAGRELVRTTGSVGVALFDGLTCVEVLAAADLALYEAKEAGRDRFAVYRSRAASLSRTSSRSRLAEAEPIQRALADHRFELFCQPIVDLTDDRVSQHELLLRLRTEDGRLLPPSAFLGLAERFGATVSIDAWVIRQACALIARQAKSGRHLRLNVNLSAKSIGSPDLLPIIDRALSREGIDPARLVFELTETATIGNIEQAEMLTAELKSRGCRLALDNFGSGFGSFHHLKHLPFDYLKIDGDIVRGVDANVGDRLVVEAVVGIAKGLGKQTIAECVSDPETVDRLRRSGVDYAQGYQIGMPRPVREALDDA